MANVNTVNNLSGDLTLTGTQNVSVSDNGLQTITITGPDLSPFATSADLTSVSGSLQTQIDDIPAGGIWELLDSVTVSGSNDTVTISGLPHRDKLFIAYEFTGIFTNNAVVRMFPNNDSDETGLNSFALVSLATQGDMQVGTPIVFDIFGFIQLTNYSNLPVEVAKTGEVLEARFEAVPIGNDILSGFARNRYRWINSTDSIDTLTFVLENVGSGIPSDPKWDQVSIFVYGMNTFA